MKCSSNEAAVTKNFRFTRKSTNENERTLMLSWWKEFVQLYGTYIDYYTYDYTLTGHDSFYGEEPLAPFSPPVGMIMLTQFNNDTLLLSKFGIKTDADVTFIVPIQDFRIAMGSNDAEPKSGDLVRLTELGSDRPGGLDDLNTVANLPLTSCVDAPNVLQELCADGIITITAANCSTDSIAYSAYDDPVTFNELSRGAQVFEITERRDENLTQTYNPLMGHYVWILHARKFDYSYQPNAPREPGMDQLSEETLYGKLSGGTATPENAKKYTQDVDTDSGKRWKYTDGSGSNSKVYGDY